MDLNREGGQATDLKPIIPLCYLLHCANIYIRGTASPRSWYLHSQTHDRGHDRTEKILQAEEQILERVEEESDIRTHRLATEGGVSQLLVHRTLKGQGLYPYHVQNVQALELADFPRRGIYCEWLLQQQQQHLVQ